ncbi:MAG: terminase family protein [Pseudomonadota bacterium]
MISDAWSDWTLEPSKPGVLETMDRVALLSVLRTPFLLSARPAQRPPFGRDWQTWLFMGGRGAGKTRAGAEFLQYAMCRGGYRRAALVAPTLHDAREVMIEGPSGLIAIAEQDEDRPTYQTSRRRLLWPNGGEAFVFSAEDPDSLRGPQFDIAWCDEIAAWSRGEEMWDMLQMGLRLGEEPRAVATTTPRPVALVKRLLSDETTVVTRSTTADNARYLAPGFLDAVERLYGGSRLGRQELDGELIDDPIGALWTRSGLDTVRVRSAPNLDRVIVAVDPPVTEGPKADTCGIIGAGCHAGVDGSEMAYVIADASVQGLSPLNWAGRVASVAREIGAERVVAEANQGGEMVRHALNTAGCDVPVRLVRAKLGKRARATPVAALYEAGRVKHVGVMRALEDEMCSFGADGFSGSPDRVDALVWALWSLLLERTEKPRVRRF